MLATFPVSKEFFPAIYHFWWMEGQINLLDLESESGGRRRKKGKNVFIGDTFYFALSSNPDGYEARAIIDLKMKYLLLSVGPCYVNKRACIIEPFVLESEKPAPDFFLLCLLVKAFICY